MKNVFRPRMFLPFVYRSNTLRGQPYATGMAGGSSVSDALSASSAITGGVDAESVSSIISASSVSGSSQLGSSLSQSLVAGR